MIRARKVIRIMGNSEVTYEVKDGVNYYTSSDKKWTVEENSFIAYFNEEKIEVGAVFKYVNYSSGHGQVK